MDGKHENHREDVGEAAGVYILPKHQFFQLEFLFDRSFEYSYSKNYTTL